MAATYCFRCPECGHWVETPFREPAPGCASDDHPDHETRMIRDYRAEGVGLAGVRVSRDGTLREQAELFLPTNAELAGPGDPDGTKGMRAWRERVEPKDVPAGKAHWPGEVDRSVF